MSRIVAAVARRPLSVQVLVSVAFGVAAAIGVAYGPGLRTPGSSILFAMIPIAFGRAVAARRFGATVSSLSGLAVLAILPAHAGLGASASLLLSGPALDATLARRPNGGVILVLAGVATNLVAFVLRAAAAPMRSPAPAAIASYVACGALAGLVAALLWRSRRS